MEKFEFDKWIKFSEITEDSQKWLLSEGFDNISSLINMSSEDLDGVALKKGEIRSLLAGVKQLQREAGTGPLLEDISKVQPGKSTEATVGLKFLEDLLGNKPATAAERHQADYMDPQVYLFRKGDKGMSLALKEELQQEVAKYRLQAFSDNTKKTYSSQRNSYLRFCNELGLQ
ncbi:unnamed protein product, partial [Owenia fusiformis]